MRLAFAIVLLALSMGALACEDTPTCNSCKLMVAPRQFDSFSLKAACFAANLPAEACDYATSSTVQLKLLADHSATDDQLCEFLRLCDCSAATPTPAPVPSQDNEVQVEEEEQVSPRRRHRRHRRRRGGRHGRRGRRGHYRRGRHGRFGRRGRGRRGYRPGYGHSFFEDFEKNQEESFLPIPPPFMLPPPMPSLFSPESPFGTDAPHSVFAEPPQEVMNMVNEIKTRVEDRLRRRFGPIFDALHKSMEEATQQATTVTDIPVFAIEMTISDDPSVNIDPSNFNIQPPINSLALPEGVATIQIESSDNPFLSLRSLFDVADSTTTIESKDQPLINEFQADANEKAAAESVIRDTLDSLAADPAKNLAPAAQDSSVDGKVQPVLEWKPLNTDSQVDVKEEKPARKRTFLERLGAGIKEQVKTTLNL